VETKAYQDNGNKEPIEGSEEVGDMIQHTKFNPTYARIRLNPILQKVENIVWAGWESFRKGLEKSISNEFMEDNLILQRL